MISNKELIIPLLEFPHENIFYFVQVLQRAKDNPELQLSNSRVIKTYYITSVQKLEDNWLEMTKLADLFNARVCINLNPRNFEKAAFKLLQKIADQMMNKDFYNVRKAYDSICGEYHSEIDKRWLIDLDKDQLELKHEISLFIYEEFTKLKNHDKVSNYSILGYVPSKSGIHIITNPFNLKDWKWPQVEIHKNNPTLLYIP